MSDFGLTGYEIKGYLTLLEFGPGTASEISENSTVPYSKIYDVLNNLETKGWIEVQQSRPNKFYPKSPSSALEIINLEAEMRRKRGEKQIIDELQQTYDKKRRRKMVQLCKEQRVFVKVRIHWEILKDKTVKIIQYARITMQQPAAVFALFTPLISILHLLCEKILKYISNFISRTGCSLFRIFEQIKLFLIC